MKKGAINRPPNQTRYYLLNKGLRERALLLSFYEAFFRLSSQIRRTAFTNGSSNGIQVQANSTDCVIVTRDNEVNAVRIGVGINDSKYRDTQVVCFFDCDVLVVSVDNEQSVRQTAHVFDTAQAVFQLVQFTSAHQRFFLGQLVEGTVLRLSFQVFQTFDGLTNGFPVSQHTAQPTMVHEELVAVQSSFFHRFACSAFSTNDQDFAFARSNFVQLSQGFVEHRYSFLKVDDVNFVTRTEDERLHFRVPVTGLVTKVNTSLEHIAHGNSCHV
ncbi:Hypothetical protein AKI40_4121 [Enterobacter sp. FY-07]|nr:Hypothetical protein AKI40_4121 [Enterobacter sp. FY-07]